MMMMTMTTMMVMMMMVIMRGVLKCGCVCVMIVRRLGGQLPLEAVHDCI